jgi:23S rRNA (cytidine1920-2'-O)/16S rRNA (cytidine1409-2'-O)-methyltransferase
MPKVRLDELMVIKGLAPTRAQAKALVMAGRVRNGTERLDKPGKELPDTTPISLTELPRFVSRGGEKLAAAVEAFKLQFTNLHVLDVGASTGGFTDCSLQAGATDVTCVDVGRAQLHPKLIQDKRVTNLEKVNARTLKLGDLPRASYDAVVMDLSFISLRSVLPAVWPFLTSEGFLVALVKPQFEAGKAEADKGKGVIKDPEVRQKVLQTITEFALTELPKAKLIGTIDSPITGADGNHEYLLCIKKG